MDPELQLLIDERDVRKVMVNYSMGVDRRDWDRVRACFLSDAVVQGTRSGGPFEEYFAGLRPGVESFGATMHKLGQQWVEIDGDRAHTESYLTARHYADAAGSEEVLTMGVCYHDDLIRTGSGRWQIQFRKVTQFWSRSAPR